MKKYDLVRKKQRLPHPIAQKLEAIIRQRLSDRQDERGLSDLALGELTYKPLGYDDVQKKINNTLRGKTGMKLSDFFILCEGLDVPPDRVFASALDKVLRENDEVSLPSKKETPENQDSYTAGSVQSPGPGAGVET